MSGQPAPVLELYLIRHGESRGNVGLTGEKVPFGLREDPPLTAKGKLQADLLGQALAGVDFAAVYASCMRRAVMTAKGVLDHQPGPKPLLLLPLLTEQGVSDEYEGLPVPELDKLCTGCRMAEGFETARRINGTPGRPDEAVLARAQEAIDYFRSRYTEGQKLAVVSHAAFLTYFIFRICGLTGQMPSFDIDLNNTGVTRVKFYRPGENPFGDTVFAYINNTAHLAALNGGKAKV